MGFAEIFEFVRANWFPLVLTVEIIGVVIVIKMGYYRKGVCFLLAALATIWIGGFLIKGGKESRGCRGLAEVQYTPQQSLSLERTYG